MRRIVAAAIGLVAFAAGPVLGAEPLKIRQAYVAVVSNWVSILFAKDGLARHAGKSYVLDPVHFKGSPQILTALATGDLEIGHLAYSSLGLAIENAGLTDLRIISGEFQDGVPGHYSDEYFVLKDSPIHKVEDLKGRVLATNGAGSAIDIGLRAMLRKHGLDERKDVTIIEASLPNMAAMLMEHKVDLFASVPPFALDPTLRSAARPLFTQREALGRTQMAVWVARLSFIKVHRAALVDYLEDALRAERWFLNPANHHEAVEIAARIGKQPPSKYDSWLFTDKDYYRDPNGLPDMQALQANIHVQKELGFLKADLDVNKYAALDLVEEAAARLKQSSQR